MNDYGRRYLIERIGKRDERRGDRRDNRDNRDYEDYEDYEDERDYEDGGDYYDQLDERRGVRGSGRGRGRGRGGGRRRRRDYEDGGDMADYHMEKPMRLTKAEKNRWKREIENTDGTRGEHFDMQQVMTAAEKLGVKFNEYSEKDFCLVTNLMYSDYGHIIKKLAGPDKELLICADMAKAYFDDPDGLEPEEKLAVHYHCMMNFE